uniref:ubiquitinyl hydrolase 1 n=1 Tax=Glossina austeni TaxID=7395 RepID=A0A1A9VF65_GLOAU
MAENDCKHFQVNVKENFLDNYRIIDAYFSACINRDARSHITSHLRAKKHSIALELSHGTLYCNSCQDFIYDSRCREIASVNRKLEAKDEKQLMVAQKSLIDRLERTKAEHLGSSAKIKCSTRKSYQESIKQFSLRTLPSLASFHLKRFEHSSLIDKKISTFISFPVEFDMTPFMSDKNNAYGDFRYSLYAVVNHVGTIDAGHYTAYVRHHKDTWIKCDDHRYLKPSVRQ